MRIKLPKSLDYKVLILISLVLLNFIVKGYFLSYNSIAGDEPFSIFHAKLNLHSIIKDLSSGNNPPLYEILLHFWIKVFGTSSAAVRLLSVIFSSITVFFIYKLGECFFNTRVAIYTSLLFIFSSYEVMFAHEARVYALLGMLSVISMYYYLRIIINNDIQRSTILIFILTNVIIIYAHYLGFFILILQFLFVIFNRELRSKYWKKLLLIAGVIILLYIPNIIIFINRFIDSSTNGTWIYPVHDLGNLHNKIYLFSNESPMVYLIVLFVIWFSAGAFVYKSKLNHVLKFVFILIIFPLFFLTGSSIYVFTPHVLLLTRETVYVYIFLFVLCCLLLFVVFSRNKTIINVQTKVIVFWLWFPLLTLFILSLDSFPYTIPMFISRYLMIISIAFYFFIAVALDAVLKPTKFSNFMLPVVLMFLFIFTSQPNISNERNVFQAVEKVKELKQDNTLVIYSPVQFNLNFTYYLDYTLFVKAKSVDEINEELKARNIIGVNNIEKVDLTNSKHIIYLDAGADFSYPDNNILNRLTADYTLESKQEVYDIFTIYEFVKAKPAPKKK